MPFSFFIWIPFVITNCFCDDNPIYADALPNCLVKGFEVPSEIKVEGIPSFDGDCGLNPYQFFNVGYSEKNFQSSTGGTVNDGVVSAIQGYLSNAEFGSWDSYGKTIYDKMLSGFGEYSLWKGLKYSDAGEANKYFVINPYKVKQ